MLALLPRLLSRGGRQERQAARLMKSQIPILSRLPAEIEWLRANVQGQSVNGGTDSPSLPGPDAQWNVLRPGCERAEPGGTARLLGVRLTVSMEGSFPGVWMSLVLISVHTQTHSYTHTLTYTHLPTISHTHPHTLTHTYTPILTYYCTHTHTDLSGWSRFGPSQPTHQPQTLASDSAFVFHVTAWYIWGMSFPGFPATSLVCSGPVCRVLNWCFSQCCFAW